MISREKKLTYGSYILNTVCMWGKCAFSWNEMHLKAAAGKLVTFGVLLLEMRHFAEAKTYFDRSMLISGVNVMALKNIAACHQMLGNIEEARKCHLQAFLLKTPDAQ